MRKKENADGPPLSAEETEKNRENGEKAPNRRIKIRIGSTGRGSQPSSR